MLEHGGRLRRAAQSYGIALEHWLDLSTGISPFAWLVPAIPAQHWPRLPEDDDGLAASAAAYYGAPQLLPVAGSQAAIQALPTLRAPSRVGVLAPGYAEHAQAWQRAGHTVLPLPAQPLLQADAHCDVIVLIHPNNPCADTFDGAALLQLHARLAARGGWLVVDEAFMDATPTCPGWWCCARWASSSAWPGRVPDSCVRMPRCWRRCASSSGHGRWPAPRAGPCSRR